MAFSTPWFQVIAKTLDGETGPPHYTVLPLDYVTVIATDEEGRFLLVKQFRPVTEEVALELPSGMVDPGETPEASARRELIEETGHEANELELLGTLVPDVGRLGNRMWCYVAAGVRRIEPAPQLEEGIELVRCTPDEFVAAFAGRQCTHALNFAVVLMALLNGRFTDVFARANVQAR